MPSNEFGDFQTPAALVAEILLTLPDRNWSRILEPTCGLGNFVRACSAANPTAQIIGIEAQPHYAREARLTTASIIERDIFTMDLGKDLPWTADGPMLVTGNPPWVTNTQLSRLDSSNRPDRVNLRNLSGYDAMTGSSNFDIAEYIWLKLITELRHESPAISLLCKTQVARNVLAYCAQFSLPVSSASLRLIDAKKWFGAAVDACLFTIDVNTGPASYSCDLYETLAAEIPARRFGIVNGRLVADLDAYHRSSSLDGTCPVEWRQGMKHDAAAVMELAHQAGRVQTRAGTPVDIEDDYLYPLLKCTDVFRGRLSLNRWVIVPQRTLNEDTQPLAQTAPKLWSYLTAHAAVLDHRKSSIYRNRPRFCVFGLGPYSFAPYKVAVSGLHKSAEFRLVGPVANKPVFFDDTCYFLPFQDPHEAAVTAALLQTSAAHDFFRALAFWDAKRPITKKLLQRLDLATIAARADPAEITTSAQLLLTAAGIPATHASDPLPTTLPRLRDSWQTQNLPRR